MGRIVSFHRQNFVDFIDTHGEGFPIEYLEGCLQKVDPNKSVSLYCFDFEVLCVLGGLSEDP